MAGPQRNGKTTDGGKRGRVSPTYVSGPGGASTPRGLDTGDVPPMSDVHDTRAARVRTGVRTEIDMVLLLKPRDPQPVFHRWARRDKRGRALPAQLDNGLPVRWSYCGKHQFDAITPAIRRDHAEVIGRACGVCFNDEHRDGPEHVSHGLAGAVANLARLNGSLPQAAS